MQALMKILQDAAGEGTITQTQSSAMLVQDEFVYKIKKPVYDGVMDYRTNKKRRSYCILEKELNDRFSEGIYTDVLKLVKIQGGYGLEPVESTLPALEYVVKIKKIPETFFLVNKIFSGNMKYEEMSEIGEKIATKLLTTQKAAEYTGDNIDEYHLRKINATGQFDVIRKTAPELINGKFRFIEEQSNAFLEKNQEIFNARYKNGFVRNGHGNLKPENIFFDAGKVYFINCIEYSENLRINDLVSEAAGVSVELDFDGFTELSDEFIEGFMRIIGGDDSLKLLNYYKCYQAIAKAKAAAINYASTETDDPRLTDIRDEFNRCVDMACIYATAIHHNYTLAFCGYMESGKSNHANLMAKHFPLAYLDWSTAYTKIYGEEVACGDYNEEKLIKVYELLSKSAKRKFLLGRVTVIAADFLLKREQRMLKDINPIFIEFETPQDILKKRINDRYPGKNCANLLHHMQNIQELRSDFLIDSTRNVKYNVEKIIGFITKVND